MSRGTNGGQPNTVGLPPAHRREDAHLVPVAEHVFGSPHDAVDEDDFDLVGREAQVLDQVSDRRALR